MNKDLIFIDNAPALKDLCERLQGCNWLAVDTEFERVNTYYPELCLLQLANHDVTAVIDPLAGVNPEPLYALLYDPAIIKVFHAARQDFELFYHLKDAVPLPLFDTQIAAELLGYDSQMGYANLVRELTGKELAKTQTRTNWKRRPLSRSQLLYAADDVIYLGQIYELLTDRLQASGKMGLLDQACGALNNPELYEPDPHRMWRKIREARRMNGRPLEILKQLAAWREITAREENQPRKWILPDHTLLELARQMPSDSEGLAQIKGINDRILQQYGARLIEITRPA
ncbi:MAG: ribonuclease D [Gammaproteobacteria bacterium]